MYVAFILVMLSIYLSYKSSDIGKFISSSIYLYLYELALTIL